MRTILLASASVHTTAAACDVLLDRLGSDDRVLVLGVNDSSVPRRDLQEAANVARTRLLDPAVETRIVEGDPAGSIRELAAEVEAAEIVVGPRRGDPDAAGNAPGETTLSLLTGGDRPVLVLPESALPA